MLDVLALFRIWHNYTLGEYICLSCKTEHLKTSIWKSRSGQIESGKRPWVIRRYELRIWGKFGFSSSQKVWFMRVWRRGMAGLGFGIEEREFVSMLITVWIKKRNVAYSRPASSSNSVSCKKWRWNLVGSNTMNIIAQSSNLRERYTSLLHKSGNFSIWREKKIGIERCANIGTLRRLFTILCMLHTRCKCTVQ